MFQQKVQRTHCGTFSSHRSANFHEHTVAEHITLHKIFIPFGDCVHAFKYFENTMAHTYLHVINLSFHDYILYLVSDSSWSVSFTHAKKQS